MNNAFQFREVQGIDAFLARNIVFLKNAIAKIIFYGIILMLRQRKQLSKSRTQLNTERYRSGHNGADSKSVCAHAHEGSNPSLSAKCGFHRARKPQSTGTLWLSSFHKSAYNGNN